jgi:phenylpropionate dioxygenase-like ring-hydroxylating dioxygenase large terminal subunit
MTAVDQPKAGHVAPSDPELTRRALEHVRASTTDLAPTVLRVPLSYYRDERLLGRELDLLKKTPLALTASARVPRAHDFLVREVLGISVLVSRAGDGVVRAYLNYCRHRGARPAEGCGNARRFSCPYHGWVYDNEGALVGIPGQRGFVDVDRSVSGLVALPCEERHGLVWVVLTADAPLDLDEHLGPLDAELSQWALSDYGHFTEEEFESAVSWKAALEAFAESYHFPYVHGDSIVGQNTIADTAIFQALGRHHRICFPTTGINAHLQGLGSWDPIDNLSLIYWVFPNLVLAFTPVGTELIDILPARTQLHCTVRHGWMAKVPPTTDQERAGYRELFDLVHAAVRDEDFAMLPQCGETIRHAQHEYMLVGRNEIGVQHVVRTLAGALGVELGR